MSNPADDFSFSFPAVMGQQSKRPFYLATVPFRVISRLIDFDTGNVLERSQRKTDPGRANAIVRYIKRNAEKGYVLPPLVGNLDAEGLKFESTENNSSCGRLRIPMDAKIKLLDGQHRTTAIIAALKELPFLSREDISIQLFTHLTVKERQQAFSDINSNAKPVSRSLNLSYNHRDSILSKLSAEIEAVRAWSGRIDRDRNAANHKLGSLFSYKHVVAASQLLIGVKSGDSIDDITAMKVSGWWNAISAAVGWDDESIDPDKVSNTAVGLMALARLGNMVLNQPASELSRDKFQCAQALFDIDWKKSAPIWEGVLVRDDKMIVGKAAEIAAAELLASIAKITKEPAHDE